MAIFHILFSVGLLATLIGDIERLREERQALLHRALHFKKANEKETLLLLDMDNSGAAFGLKRSC